MNFKTKILSLVIFGLLILPAIFVPVQTGNVLGVNEVIEEDSQEGEGEISALGAIEKEEDELSSEPSLKTNQVSSIGSGVRDVADEEEVASKSENEKNVYSGLAKYDPKQRVSLSTNKFSLGQSLKIITYEKEHSLVVNQIRQDLEDGVVIIVNKDTFVDLGGDLNGEGLVEVEIYID